MNKTYMKAIYATIVICLLFYVEQFLAVNYVWKTIIKIILFLSALLVFQEKISFRINENTKKSILCAVVVFSVIIGTYFVLQTFIDLQSIAQELEVKQGITKSVFLLVGAYIILGNSLIEEMFFRGFLRQNMFFSAIAFSIYHTAIFWTWFSPMIMATSLTGLFLGGLLFAYLNKKETILNGLIVHIGADLGIILVGLMMFNFF